MSSFQRITLICSLFVAAVVLEIRMVVSDRAENSQQITFHSEVEGGRTVYKIDNIQPKTLENTPIGKKVCSLVFYTTSGTAFVWPDTSVTPATAPSKCYDAVLYRDAQGNFHAHVNHLISSTGYDTIPPTGVPVILE
jgi:hypothetical protein